MTETNPPEWIEIDHWPFRIRQPAKQTEETRVLLLLHGHLGNENVMWILTQPLPDAYIMLAPRAPVKTGPEKYSWHEIGKHWPEINTYHGLTEELLRRVNTWSVNQHLNVGQIDVMGFSQGAVMAYALAILHPKKIGKIAALAGLIPLSWKAFLNRDAFDGRKIFIAHGTRDEMVPIEKARQAVRWLREKGAQVTFCEADTGHKISANCFHGLGDFFRKL